MALPYEAKWRLDKVLSHYVDQRVELCDFMERLEITFPAPICCDCRISRYMDIPGLPDISPRNYEEDLDWKVCSGSSEFIQEQLKIDSDFAFQCKLCIKELRPWEMDEFYVTHYSFEELYSVPIVPPHQINPSNKLKEKILEHYGKKCFNCNSNEELHIDHINPRLFGGNAIFTNLQPLCEQCGQLKGSSTKDPISLTDTMLFGPYPSDFCEDLFW